MYNRHRERHIQQCEVQKQAEPYANMVEGATAKRRGRTISACPYLAGSPAYMAWRNGWESMNHDDR